MQDNDRFDIETGLTLCDREPIHCPGSIQPHGLLIVADPLTLAVVAVAGDVEARLAEKWQACALGDLLGQPVEQLTKRLAAGPVTLAPIDGITERFQVVARLGEDHILVEIEPTDARAQTAGEALAWVEAAGSDLERTHDLVDLCETAVRMFRDLTGYDRVMIYRFRKMPRASSSPKASIRGSARSSITIFPRPTSRARRAPSTCATEFG